MPENNQVSIKWFEQKGGKFGNNKVSVMLTGKGRGGFGFLAGFFNAEGISKFNHVLFGYDKKNRRIFFAFKKDGSQPGAFKLTKTRQATSASVFPFSFWSGFSIDPKDWAGQYPPHELREENHGKTFFIQHSERDTTN